MQGVLLLMKMSIVNNPTGRKEESMNAQQKETTEEEYEEQLNDIFGTVEICGMTFDSGRALKELDPTAFRVGMSDIEEPWICSECDSEHDNEDDAEECCKEEEEVDETE